MPPDLSSTATTSAPAATRESKTSRRWSTASSTAGAWKTPGSISRCGVGSNREETLGLFGRLRLRIAAGRHPWADHRDLVLGVSLDQERLVGYPEPLVRPMKIERVAGGQRSADHARSR